MEEGFAVGRKVGLKVSSGVDVVVISGVDIGISEQEKGKAVRQWYGGGFRECGRSCLERKQDEEEEEEAAEA